MKPTTTLPILALIALVAAATAHAQFPSLLNYQGRVTVGGTNLTTNAARFKFALVSSNGSTVYWKNDGTTTTNEPLSAVPIAVAQGLYSVLLGDTTLSNMAGLTPSVFTNNSVNLRVWFAAGGTNNAFVRLSPDMRIAASGYAMRAAMSDTGPLTNLVKDLTVTGDLTVEGTVYSPATLVFAPGGSTGLAIGPMSFNASFQGLNVVGGFESNAVTGPAVGSTIAGGGGLISSTFLPNTINGDFSSIGGGLGNTNNSGDYATIAGGSRNTASGDYASMGGGYLNSAASYGTVAGGFLNAAVSYASVGGGVQNQASNSYATVAGGWGNQASGTYSAVVGGYDNTASGNYAIVAGGAGNSAAGSNSFVGAGKGNVASGVDSVIVGGRSNAAVSYASVGGGVQNQASNSYATVAGGWGNQASGTYSAVVGGYDNTASGNYAIVAGGAGNSAAGSNSFVGAGTGNVASGENSVIVGGLSNVVPLIWRNYFGTLRTNWATNAFIGGGYGNIASGPYTTVAGGWANSAEGSGATVGGGTGNTAAGTHSTIPGGQRCYAVHQYSFVWSGSDVTETRSFGDETFTIRAQGGARFYTADDTNTGVSLASGTGTWTSLSDRNAKANFQRVDASDVLAKVAAMPVMTWNYKTQAEEIRHIGPTAQDFRAAFGVGETDTGITTVDADGVALAAIQGLVEELKARDKTIEELKAKSEKVDRLESELRALRDQVQSALPPAP